MAHLTAQDWHSLIEEHPELGELPANLRRRADRVVAAGGQRVFRMGEKPTRVFLVLKGEVRLLRTSRNGAEIVLQRARTGFVADASIDASRYHCDALAATDAQLLSFPIGPFRLALRNNESFRGYWMSRLAREVRQLRSQCERLALHSATDRIEHYIESEGSNGVLEMSQTRKAWAAELGITHEALYRALATLKRFGRLSMVERRGSLTLSLRRG